MKFLEVSKMLNEKNQGKIVLIKSGIFFVATGRSALALGSLLPLKRTCISYGICKVGIPVGSIGEYLEELKTGRYKHSAYKTFYIYEPKERKIQSAKYIDRIVHRWYVESFMKEYIIKQFISTSYACIKGRGMHSACVAVQKGMRHCKRIYGEYYIIKMDVLKYFQKLLEILKGFIPS